MPRTDLLDLEGIRFLYEPYPIGVAKPVIAPDLYREMVATFPPIELFGYTPGTGHKYVLSEKRERRVYNDWLKKHPCWREFSRYIRSQDFIRYVLGTLSQHHIDLGLDFALSPRYAVLAQTLASLARGHAPHVERLRGRFQFSALPAKGGYVRPHTDTPKKRITLIVSIVGEDEWDPAYGGGTDMNRARQPQQSWDWCNEGLPFEDVEVIRTFDFVPNQCVLFVKTFNSIHSVPPMQAEDPEALRRTITINLEIEH